MSSVRGIVYSAISKGHIRWCRPPSTIRRSHTIRSVGTGIRWSGSMKSRAVYMTYCLVTRLSLIVDRSVMLNEKLVSWCFAPSQPQKNYIRAENKRQSISCSFRTKATKAQNSPNLKQNIQKIFSAIRVGHFKGREQLTTYWSVCDENRHRRWRKILRI